MDHQCLNVFVNEGEKTAIEHLKKRRKTLYTLRNSFSGLLSMFRSSLHKIASAPNHQTLTLTRSPWLYLALTLGMHKLTPKLYNLCLHLTWWHEMFTGINKNKYIFFIKESFTAAAWSLGIDTSFSISFQGLSRDISNFLVIQSVLWLQKKGSSERLHTQKCRSATSCLLLPNMRQKQKQFQPNIFQKLQFIYVVLQKVARCVRFTLRPLRFFPSKC